MSHPDDIEQQKNDIASVFSRAAPGYDQVGPRLFSYFGKSLVDFAGIPSGANVLDVACGRGAALFAAADVVGAYGHVMGIDLSETMVQETGREIQRQKLGNAEIRCMDAENLQFPDESFDVVLCGFALFFFPQLEDALAEMRRVLKPGGRLVVSTWDRSEDEHWRWYEELFKAHMPPEDEPEETDHSTPSEPELDTTQGLKEVLVNAGFTAIQLLSENFDCVYRDEQEWWDTLWTHFGRRRLENLEQAFGADGLDRFRAAVFEGLQALKQPDGIHSIWQALLARATKPA